MNQQVRHPWLLICQDNAIVEQIDQATGDSVELVTCRQMSEALIMAGHATGLAGVWLHLTDDAQAGWPDLWRAQCPETLSDVPVLLSCSSGVLAELTDVWLDAGRVSDVLDWPAKTSRIRSRLQALERPVIELDARQETLDQNETEAVFDALLFSICTLVEMRDSESGNHLRRMQEYLRVLGHALQNDPDYAAELANGRLELIQRVAPLHDIGNIGVPDSILLKPGRLKPEELAVMKQHTVLGKNVIEDTELLLGFSTPYLAMARKIIHSHHERWDGSGYPLGLVGDAIPLAGRMLAVLDVYDAVISKRLYKPSRSHQEALEIIASGRGAQFDPGVVDAFMQVHEEIEAIARRLQDADTELQDQIALLERVVTIDRIEL